MLRPIYTPVVYWPRGMGVQGVCRCEREETTNGGRLVDSIECERRKAILDIFRTKRMHGGDDLEVHWWCGSKSSMSPSI